MSHRVGMVRAIASRRRATGRPGSVEHRPRTDSVKSEIEIRFHPYSLAFQSHGFGPGALRANCRTAVR